jgi:hypothetical protein
VATNATTKIRPKPTIVVFFMEITSFLLGFSALSVPFLTSEEKIIWSDHIGPFPLVKGLSFEFATPTPYRSFYSKDTPQEYQFSNRTHDSTQDED